MSFDPEKLKQFLAAKKAAPGSQTGGKGSMRRKTQAVARNRAGNVQDDKKLRAALHKLQVREIPGIEEVTMMKGDEMIQISRPKVEAAVHANTYVVSGRAVTKNLQEMLPELMQQLSSNPELMQQFMAAQAGMGGMGGMEAMLGGAGAGAGDDDDEDIPSLVDNFNAEE